MGLHQFWQQTAHHVWPWWSGHLTYSWQNYKWSGKKHWFVKQDLFRMPLHDSSLLYILQLEQHPDQFKFKGQLEVVVDETDFVLDTLQAFLGWQNCVLRTRYLVLDHRAENM